MNCIVLESQTGTQSSAYMDDGTSPVIAHVIFPTQLVSEILWPPFFVTFPITWFVREHRSCIDPSLAGVQSASESLHVVT